MPARPWLVDASDADATVAEPESDSPEVGEDLIAGWVVTNTEPLGESKLNDLAVWVIAKGRFRVIRQATDRSSKAAAVSAERPRMSGTATPTTTAASPKGDG